MRDLVFLMVIRGRVIGKALDLRVLMVALGRHLESACLEGGQLSINLVNFAIFKQGGTSLPLFIYHPINI